MPHNYLTFVQEIPGASFSDWMRHRAQKYWEAMIGHRFTLDMGSDALSDGAFARYLRNEHRFVRTAVKVFALALAKAPSADDQRHLAAILSALTNEQEDYFRAVAGGPRAGTTAPDDAGLPATVLALGEGVLAITVGATYEEILSTMLAAEWMYLEWCCRENARGPVKPEPARWIAMHAGGDFAEGVAWTRERVDALCPTLDLARQESCARNFGRMLQLEILFHDAVYLADSDDA